MAGWRPLWISVLISRRAPESQSVSESESESESALQTMPQEAKAKVAHAITVKCALSELWRKESWERTLAFLLLAWECDSMSVYVWGWADGRMGGSARLRGSSSDVHNLNENVIAAFASPLHSTLLLNFHFLWVRCSCVRVRCDAMWVCMCEGAGSRTKAGLEKGQRKARKVHCGGLKLS